MVQPSNNKMFISQNIKIAANNYKFSFKNNFIHHSILILKVCMVFELAPPPPTSPQYSIFPVSSPLGAVSATHLMIY